MSESTTYIAAIGGGLGDVVVALPVISALVEKGKTILVLRTPRQLGFDSLIPGLSGTIKEIDLAPLIDRDDTRYINLRGHRLQTDYFWGGPEFEADYPDFKINDILQEMCREFDIKADFEHLQPMPFNKMRSLHNTVICIPGTTVDTKTWSTGNWLELKQRIEKLGFSTALLGQPEYSNIVKELMEQGFERLPTSELKDAVDILSSCRAVVSVDTGLMHIAVQQGTRTICLFQDPIFHRPQRNAYPLFSKHCAAICVEKRMTSRPEKVTEYPEWNWLTCEFKACMVPEAERCINSITVEDIVKRFNDAILT